MRRIRKTAKNSDSGFNFDHEQKVMKMFTDNAKAYIQLASAGLALTVAFMDKFVHRKSGHDVVPDGWLKATWIMLLGAIMSGAFYQYLGVKYLEQHLPSESFEGWNWLAERCGVIYGIMLTAFYAAVLCFTVFAINALSNLK